jgi:hypothetical protein
MIRIVIRAQSAYTSPKRQVTAWLGALPRQMGALRRVEAGNAPGAIRASILSGSEGANKMSRSKLLVASIGGAVFLSFSQVAVGTDTGASTNDSRDGPYQLAMADCDAMASLKTKQGACRTMAESARANKNKTRTAFVIDKSVMTDSQGRLQFDP